METHQAPYKNEAWLKHEVETRGKSLSQISKEQGVSSGAVHYYARKYGIISLHQQVYPDFADRGWKPKKYVGPFSKKVITNKKKQQIPKIEVGDYVEVLVPGHRRLNFVLKGEVVYSNDYYFQVLSSGFRESVMHVDFVTGHAKLKKHVKKADLKDWEECKKLLGGVESVHRGGNAGAENG